MSRNYDLDVNIENGMVEHVLTVDLKNSANPGLGKPGVYKSYIRVIVPQDAEVVGNYEVEQGKGKKELGFLTEVVASETKTFTVKWSTPIADSANGYGLYFRKQAGTPDTDNLRVSVVAPDHTYSYNTSLDRDFITKISWTNKF